MGGVGFVVYQDGSDLAQAFRDARLAAVQEFSGMDASVVAALPPEFFNSDLVAYSGTVASKQRVEVWSASTLSRPAAEAYADKLLDKLDEPYCNQFSDVAAAVRVAAADGGTCIGWVFCGVALD